jgi:ferritin
VEEKKIRSQDKWNAKAGLISKSYKLKRELTEQFAEACETAGVSQAGQITKMMKEFIDEQNK